MAQLLDSEILKMLGFIISGGAFGFLYRFVLKLLSIKNNKMVAKNIGKNDRVLRFIFAVGLLFSYFYFRHNLLLFFSGFCFYEAFFSWCGLYALIGKNSCPL